VLARWGSYGGTVQERIDDLQAMFADESVRVIWAARGGSGGTALLPHLDYRLIERNPKVLIGYSDLTALLQAIHVKTGLITFHGPTAGSRFTDYNLLHLKALLFDGAANHVMPHAPENLALSATEPANEVKTYKEGVGTGPLLPGNLSLIAALQGTPYAMPLAGSVVCIEEVGEEPYRLDRMLHQLQQVNGRGSKALADCAAVLIGVFTRYAAKPEDRQLSLREVFDHHLSALPIPAATGYSFGHIAHQMTLPVGAMARADTREGTLTILDSVVS
jgi:muramoyltetrapeptide carboxypeptidase